MPGRRGAAWARPPGAGTHDAPSDRRAPAPAPTPGPAVCVVVSLHMHPNQVLCAEWRLYSWPIGCQSPTLPPRLGAAAALSTSGRSILCRSDWRGWLTNQDVATGMCRTGSSRSVRTRWHPRACCYTPTVIRRPAGSLPGCPAGALARPGGGSQERGGRWQGTDLLLAFWTMSCSRCPGTLL